MAEAPAPTRLQVRLQAVAVVFLKGAAGETPEEQLLVQFQGMIAEYERAQIAERSRRGKRHRARPAA
jgi:site-specific DNA recombinase